MVVGEFTQETDLLVLGGGPGGYHAAFRAAQHGIQTTILESMPALGGVCLHRGCIPSKTYLAMAETMHQAGVAAGMGIEFGAPKLNIEKMRAWKNDVLKKLSGGLDMQAKKYKVDRIQGTGRFEDGKHLSVEHSDGANSHIKFKHCIIATGSKAIELKGVQIESPRVFGSRLALELENIPKTLLVLGGGYIGLELGQVYAAFGSKVTVVEMLPGLMTGCDRDLARPLLKRLEEQFEQICLETKVVGMKEVKDGIEVAFEGKQIPKNSKFDKVLVSVGRRPNTRELQLDKAGVAMDERGFIKVDSGFKTSAQRIYAIGDVIGNPMLAHKAMHEGTALADILAGKNEVFEPRAIPAVVFTDPAIAWAGLTEDEAKQKKIEISMYKMPWSASGRAVSIGRTDGVTKVIVDKKTQRVLGVGICGTHAGEMIAEGVLAIEMGATAYDLAKTIHPHPTLSEGLYEAAMSASE